MKMLITAITLALASQAQAEGQTHHVAIHVDQNDPQVMNMALNNAQNMDSFYADQGDSVVIEVVTYGPGLMMLVKGQSPVEQRISAMSLEMENLSFSACQNTLNGMQKSAGHDIPLVSEAAMTPSGVVRLVALQEQGYAYIRP
ncbi:hypothetical protein P775_25065 [Puniceibacterium antarcticum]|uniref:Uncharacterized protein n=1 Tax=Puniceibacterium antarcticum TaxID=1206336 RepID=A0A2G8R3X2_9RHOB|nr:DsrE family protein [Puniceibacterium antarcticum]PIL16234.1 hypothetical protein P775_25065 [Puniceibacterium antarcticum]